MNRYGLGVRMLALFLGLFLGFCVGYVQHELEKKRNPRPPITIHYCKPDSTDPHCVRARERHGERSAERAPP